MTAALALDIGGTKLAAGLVDRSGRVRSFLVEPTPPAAGPGPVLERLFALRRKAVVDVGADWPDVAAVGIAAAGRSTPSAGSCWRRRTCRAGGTCR